MMPVGMQAIGHTKMLIVKRRDEMKASFLCVMM